jgi:nucleoside-diphosphate-sugar epimerase
MVKPEVIFHLAGHAAGARNLELVLPTFQSNLVTTVNVLTVATEIGCHRIVLASSMEEPEHPTDVPSSPYAASKWASSAYGRMFHALYQAPVVVARVFITYGPGEKPTKLIHYVIRSLLQREAPKLSSGQRQVDWIYIDDVVDGLLAAAHVPAVEGCTIDVGSGNLVSIRSIVEHLVRLIDPQIEPLFGTLAERPFEQVRMADTARSYAIMGWKPATSLEEGLERTVDWYRRQLKASSGI